MATKLAGGVKGVDHIAYVTWNPAETIHFYRDVLGFPLVHCILAPGWGNEPHPDFAHFFFHIGADAKMAWFYYFGQEKYEDPNVTNLLKKARHLALLVDTAEELEHYKKRLEDAGYPIRHGVPVAHEMIESIYVYDPNGYNLEFSRVLRPITEADTADTELSIEALIEVSQQPEPSLAKVWARKGELLLAQEGA